MQKCQLLLKYKGKYIGMIEDKSYDFIKVPYYHYYDNKASWYEPALQNISIFIALLLSGNISEYFESNDAHDLGYWQDIFESIGMEYIYMIGDNTYFYDIDEFMQKEAISFPVFDETLDKLNLFSATKEELENVNSAYLRELEKDILAEDNYQYKFVSRVAPDLLNYIRKNEKLVDDKSVLLLYSGGKDSTLSAIRLINMGYNVDFIHFNNGYMLDYDKPFLTFLRTFNKFPGYRFLARYNDLEVNYFFNKYFAHWKNIFGDNLTDGSLDSEVRCLSCRLAMYTVALKIAKEKNYKYIADGARINQKFMLEQPAMIKKFKELGKELGVEFLFPVLEINDEDEIKELLAAGFSAKSWEAKCLLGRKAKDKTEEDEEVILNYYDEVLKPKILAYVKHESD